MDQSLYLLIEIPARIHFNCVSKYKLPQTLRKLDRVRQDGVIREHWNDRNTAPKGDLDLDSDRIVLITDTVTPTFSGTHPIGSDDGNHEVGFLHRLVDLSAKITAQWNRVDVHEHRGQSIVG